MKKITAAIFATCLLATACQKDDDATIPGELTLKMGQTVQLQPNAPQLTFVGITEDSRCPLIAACFWRGRAVAKFRAVEGDHSLREFSLADYDNPNREPRQATLVFGHRIELLEVTPWPDSTAIPQEAYRVSIKVD